MTDLTAPAHTDDTLLGGRVSFRQPATGYRVAIDPVLLAASLPADLQGKVIDLGCGAGAAMLCLAARLPQLQLTGLERDPAMAALARDNVARNDLAARARVLTGDVRTPPPALAPESFDAAIFNPPYLEASSASPPPDAAKSAATVEGEADLAAWIAAALRLVRRKGTIALVQRADRLEDILAALRSKAGEIVVFPLWPRQGEAAKRVLVRARKGIASPLRLAAGLALHGPDGKYTTAADAVLRDGAALDL
jgi:tRNA1(Val) A37 N6-methylase TrmN6